MTFAEATDLIQSIVLFVCVIMLIRQRVAIKKLKNKTPRGEYEVRLETADALMKAAQHASSRGLSVQANDLQQQADQQYAKAKEARLEIH